MAWVNGKRTVRCYKCYGVGHNRRNCPTLSEAEKAHFKEGEGARKCSYCNGTGHNRKSCATLRVDIQAYSLDNAAYRKETLDKMVASGLGIGSLIFRGEPNTPLDKIEPDELFVVANIDWHRIQRKAIGDYVLWGHCVGENGYSNNFNLPGTRSYARYETNVLTRVAPDSILASVPDGWLNGKSGSEDFFKGRKR